MKKLVNGIIDFRRNVLKDYKKKFSELALGQSPDALYIGCSDSRVAVNLFASTDPGDLFVTRNVGNLVPPWSEKGAVSAGDSESAVIEFALGQLKVSNIIVCGHSECGAMQAICNGRHHVDSPNLKEWLRHGEESLVRLEDRPEFAKEFSRHNRVSMLNVLLQMEHLKTYPLVQAKLKDGSLVIHGWWFELKNADVYAYEESMNDFVLFDEPEAARILARIDARHNQIRN